MADQLPGFKRITGRLSSRNCFLGFGSKIDLFQGLSQYFYSLISCPAFEAPLGFLDGRQQLCFNTAELDIVLIPQLITAPGL